MFILKKEHQPGVYVPLRALFLVRLFFIVIREDSIEISGICGTVKLLISAMTFNSRCHDVTSI